MENYIVSARKYRPATFDTVVGQASLTLTLKNSVLSGKLAHAYLFCGPRGVGKTTCARIFAKTINCQALTPRGEACNECESCRSFNEKRSYNIHELDAASNNSVDDIRQLVEQVRIPPQIGRYKVYIIDEVHMLSSSAFNAFLKTLEEPPAHAIFILATTEKHKILPTILSRCQIYDFNRITVEDAAAHLQSVATQEGLTAEPEALHIIAQKADGGMRDALSIFDQVVSFTGGDITYQKVIENLHVLDYEYYFRLIDQVLEHRVGESLLLFNEVLSNGFDGGDFVSGLSSHLRDLLVSRDEATLPLLQVGASTRQRYLEQARRCTPRFLYAAMKLCNTCDLSYRASRNKRLLVELALIQLTQLGPEGEDPVGGRSPQQALSPCFPVATSATPAVGTSAAAPAPAAPATPPTPMGQAATHPAAPTSPTPATPEAAQAPPVAYKSIVAQHSTGLAAKKNIREPMSISIRNPQLNKKGAPAAEASPTVAPTQPMEDKLFNERDLNFYWMEYAQLLPQEQVAFAKRMQLIRPTLLKDGTTAEVVVQNELVEKHFRPLVPAIEAHLRTQLQNSRIKLKFRVSEAPASQMAVSAPERYRAMCQKNPALQQLQAAFGLELH